MSRRTSGRDLDGVLLVDKPQGPTSFDVVKRVERALRARKAGHTGTLDPMATGLLVICLGQATRLVPYLTAANKRYRAVVRLGIATDTLDAEGQVVRTDAPEAVAAVDRAAIEAVLPRFRGVIEQRPPAFSAIRVDGQRLHERARAGEVVEAPLRTVQIDALTLEDVRLPDFEITVTASKGTYIRSLGADIAGALGLGGHLVALRREACLPFEVARALTLEAIEAHPEAAEPHLMSAAQALEGLPVVWLDAGAAADLRHGRKRAFPEAPIGPCRALDASGQLVAIIEAAGAEPAIILRGFAASGLP